MARKFLYLIAILVGICIAALVVLRLYSDDLAKIALVPNDEFKPAEALASNAYADPSMWITRPDQPGENLIRWQPAIAKDERDLDAAPDGDVSDDPPAFAVFFVHPTSFLTKTHWNGPLDDEPSQNLARLFTKGMASPFGQAESVWTPRYRQATVGAFLVATPDAQKAVELAYEDVSTAFDAFLAGVPKGQPIVLAGHSQGALHILTLLNKRIAGTPLSNRIAAVYAVGWPISVDHDLPALGLPACDTPERFGCVASWMSYAEPAEPGSALELYRSLPGLDGKIRGQGAFLCFNPLTGSTGASANTSANLGTLVPNEDFSNGELVRQAVPARCDAQGLLLIGDPPELGPFVQPGNNYHVYDIPLFWANVKADVGRRVTAWQAAH